MNIKIPKDIAGKISIGILLLISSIVALLMLLNLITGGEGQPSAGDAAILVLYISGYTLAPVGSIVGIIGILESPRVLATIGLIGNLSLVIYSVSNKF